MLLQAGRAGAGEFGRGVAGDSGVVHHPRFGHVPGAGLVQQAAVVPEHGVADRPPVMIDARRLAGMVHQGLEQLFGFGCLSMTRGRKAVNPFHILTVRLSRFCFDLDPDTQAGPS